jgi:hypothetical protein
MKYRVCKKFQQHSGSSSNFTDRTKGVTKMSGSIIKEAIFGIVITNKKTSFHQIIKFIKR